jgi:CheY-like chemotaxis protein
MSREVLARAFEPFFTTKTVGKGSGLGLSMVYGFVRQSNGHIRIESELGRGTTVRVYLPEATDEAPSVEHLPAGARSMPRERLPRTRRVLVVEDNEAVRDIATATLVEAGYSVIEAGSAAAALELLAADPDVDVIFTDVVMPGEISGMDLVKLLAERWPRIAVVLTSGYAECLATTDEVPADLVFLPKPYRPGDVLRAVRAAVERGKPGEGPVE